MVRPVERDEQKSAKLHFRVTPALKAKLEVEARLAGRNLSAECEERLWQSMDETDRKSSPETQTMLAEIEKLIGVIEAATDQKWHAGVKAWAAVQQMLGAGPIIAHAPPQIAESDSKLKKLIKERTSISTERLVIAKSLKIAGIDTSLAMYFAPPQGGREKLRKQVEELGLPDAIRENAMAAVEALESLDDRERDINERAEKITAPFKRSIEQGRQVYEKPGMGWTLATVLRRLDFAEQGEMLGILAPQRTNERPAQLPQTTLADAKE